MTAENDFAAWVDRRCADALGHVFDEFGGRLLLLAVHLTAQQEDARDLVQATFVAAMAHGKTWDRRRPLWPWLAGILHNEARMLVRRRQRRREVELATATDQALGADPSRVAASEEVLAAIVANVDALPLPYRQVLRLRLLHGLPPIAIAQSLEVPVGTVRAQLHRGLEHLRGALPAGIGAAVALLLVGEQDLLAQVRAQVLTRVGAGEVANAGGGPWSTTFAAPAKGKALAVTGLGLALASMLMVFALPPLLGKEPAPRPGGANARAATTSASATTSTSFDERIDASATARPVPTWALTVHVTDGTGAPIRGAFVRTWTAPAGSVWNREAGTFLREEVAAGDTDHEGTWRDALAAVLERPALWRRTNQLWVQAGTPTCAAETQVFDVPADLDAAPLAVEFRLRSTRGITGRVVDRDGTPVAGAELAKSMGANIGAGPRGSSGTDGRFFVACGGTEDEWPARLVAIDAEHGAATITPPRGDGVVDVGDVVLQPNGRVRGRLVLGDGLPLAGFQVRLQQFDPAVGDDVVTVQRWLMQHERRSEQVELHDGRAMLTAAQANTDAEGRFAFDAVDPDGTFLLDLWTVRTVGTVARAGDEQVELRVDMQLLTIEVVDEHGAPLPGAAIHLDGYDPAGTNPAWKPRLGFPATGQLCGNWVPCGDPEGRRICLSPFGFVWRLYSTDGGIAPTAVRHEALPGVWRTTCRVELHPDARPGKLHVVAVDERGDPVRFGLELTALDRDAQHDFRRSLSPPEGLAWDLPPGRWRVDVTLGKELIFLNGGGGFARGSQQHEVSIAADHTTELRLVAPAAGLIAFEPFGAVPDGEGWRTLRITADGSEVAYLPVDPDDPRPATRMGARPTRFVTAQAWPPGEHTFLITAEGCQEVRCTAKVVADEVARVRVELFTR